jgi:predicted nucleic acid-binding protein
VRTGVKDVVTWAVVNLVTPYLREHEAATSILAYAEVVEYIKGFPDFVTLHTQLRRLLRHIYPYFLTYRILERYADLRRSLRRPYGAGLIGDIDTLIAATALERNLTVVTIDTDFQRVPNLRVILLSRSTMQVLSTP